VTAETRGAWPRAFFGRENMHRFTTPMENHRGPFYYHAVGVLVLFAPWSVFLGAALRYGVKAARRGEAKNPESQPPPPRRERESALGGVADSRSGVTESSSEGLTPPLPAPRAAEIADASEARHAGATGEGAGTRGSSPSSPSPPPDSRPFRFLICWLSVYLVIFSIAATKLPNYVLPLYPAIAILTARFLERWRTGALVTPRWLMPAVVAGMAGMAVLVAGGMLVASGTVNLLRPGSRLVPGLERWAVIGVVPLVAAVLMWRAVRANDRARFVRVTAVSAVVFTALIAAFPPLVIDEQKAARELVRASGVSDPSRDVRLAQFHWFQPSLVFYSQREVAELKEPETAAWFLAVPTPAYLFVPAKTWEQNLAPMVWVPTRIVARHYDFNRNHEILVVTNDVTAVAGR
jgi:4-amino-4-deoxy-L-arabinose transferase-like glycosyltransferase